MPLLDESDINSEIENLSEWNYIEKTITKDYSFDTYLSGIDFVNKLALIASVFLYFSAPWVTVIFTNDLAIQTIASNYLQMICLIFPMISIGITVGRILNGLGLGMPSLVITIIRVVGVAGPLAYYFVYILNKPLEWMWYSMIISAIIASIISSIWLKVAFKKLLPA